MPRKTKDPAMRERKEGKPMAATNEKEVTKVIIKDAEGRTYSCRISERDRDGMEIAVKGLASGKYTVKISGIRLRGDTAYTSITASFRVK